MSSDDGDGEGAAAAAVTNTPGDLGVGVQLADSQSPVQLQVLQGFGASVAVRRKCSQSKCQGN